MRGHAVNLSTPTLPFTGSSDSTRLASQMAAERAGKSAQTARGKVYEYIRACGSHGCTDKLISRVLGMDGSTARPRRIELMRAGLIEVCGKSDGATLWRVK